MKTFKCPRCGVVDRIEGQVVSTSCGDCVTGDGSPLQMDFMLEDDRSVEEYEAQERELRAEVDHIKAITDERGKNYGKPIDHFACCQEMYDEWERRFDSSPKILNGMKASNQHQALKHGVHWILDKLVRAAENPMHKDNWDDIEGYARCIKDALGLEEK